MKTWEVAALVAVATLAAIAAAYGVGMLAGVQAGASGAAPIGREPPGLHAGVAGPAGVVGLERAIYLRNVDVVLGPG
ncbi:hypothetical protein [Agromyces sp. S2-1-8]|uniref:hypothetical protein n=1 Tax=Agromyces sp. S2-1-8 TaxID=2897180 RepID=UPI001E5210CF|nr:hypothetical protein [Agromyces sp. S2-1-8]MCD5348365.1 hypothetical protein [Agromyces sp. S2-1-8]